MTMFFYSQVEGVPGSSTKFYFYLFFCLLNYPILIIYLFKPETLPVENRERSGSVVECLTRDRGAAGSSLTGVTALWSLSKTHLS